MCKECYVADSRCTPLLKPLECLKNHTQYICSACGRCICIEADLKRSLQRWNFPFKTLEIARMYLRAADTTAKKACGIYQIENSKGGSIYKIFTGADELQLYLKKHKDKSCPAAIRHLSKHTGTPPER